MTCPWLRCMFKKCTCITSYCVYSIVYHAIWQAKVHLINPWNSMQSTVLAKCHTIFIVVAVAELLMPCLRVNYPDSQVRFNSNKKPTDKTLFQLYQTDRQQSRWNQFTFNAWNERFELACNYNDQCWFYYTTLILSAKWCKKRENKIRRRTQSQKYRCPTVTNCLQ
jgi:hypothetical protein